MQVLWPPAQCWLALTVSALMSACVTINVYFPAAAAERAADQIIHEVWREPPAGNGAPAAKPAAPPPQAYRAPIFERRLAFWRGVLDILIPPAQAAADITINTPAVNGIKSAMAARFEQLRPYFNSGAVGLTQDGLLVVRDLNAVALPERAKVNQLVQQDNQDRNALYREIAKANRHPEWESEIRATFARQWIGNARPGWWYQGPGGWTRK